MAHKQQSAARPAAVRSLTEADLLEIRHRRLALEAKFQEMEMQILALRKQREAMQDEQHLLQARRRLRYPKVD